jgi:hypothetical protein
MHKKIVIYAIHGVSPDWSGAPFDKSKLPFTVLTDVTIENVSSLLTPDSFTWAKTALSEDDFKELLSTSYALVYRYETAHENYGDDDAKAEQQITTIAACLRLIRPMRQKAVVIQGRITPEKKFDVHNFGHPRNLMEVPYVQKLFTLRTDDLDSLRVVVQPFLKAMYGEYWKIRLAVQYHDGGHWQDTFWKPKFSLWVSGIESLFATDDNDHSGRLVVSERIKYFLGADTNIYEPGDIPSYFPQAKFSVGEIIKDLYEVRNYIVHGAKVPDEYWLKARDGGSSAHEINKIDVLFEGLSFILRKSLLKVFKDNFVEDFKDRVSSRKYWKGFGLTRRDLLGEKEVLRALKAHIHSMKPGDVTAFLNKEKQDGLKLLSDADTAKYLKAGVAKGLMKDNGDGTYNAV